MQKTNPYRKNSFRIRFALLTMIVCIGFSLAATIYYFHGTARNGNILKTFHVAATASFQTASQTNLLRFTEGGQQEIMTARVENHCTGPLHYYFTVQATEDAPLADAVLVYYNQHFIGTLAEVSRKQIQLEEAASVVAEEDDAENRIIFELHQAAQESYYDGKSVAVTVTAYTESVDVVDAIYVSDALEFHRAVDDINSGMLLNAVDTLTERNYEEGKMVGVPKIVLMNNIVAEDVIKHPCAIELNGYTLSGSLEINDSHTVVDVRNTNTETGMEAKVTLRAYDAAMTEKLLKERILSRCGEGLVAGQKMPVLGTLAFYGCSITVPDASNYTFQKDWITAGSLTETAVEEILVALPLFGNFPVDFKVLGTNENLAAEYLTHMPTNTDTISWDLFLPTAIKEKNATITWTSMNPDIMDDSGRIVAPHAKQEPVELLAEIRVNDTVSTARYSFNVTARSNESNFYKLVAEISPMTVYYVYDSDNIPYTTYYLPVAEGSYSYKTDYSTPEASDYYENNPSYLWKAYSDIGLTKLEYYMTDEQKADYDYIELKQSGDNYYILLNQYTPNNYARINVKGTYATGEEYTSIVNVIIATGKNTELMEVAFHAVAEKLNEIDVLYNMLTTRKADGMLNEKGDFTMPAKFEEYVIEYSAVNDVISGITLSADGAEYTISVDPTKFATQETKVPLNCTIRHGSKVENTRTLYFTVPAVIHTEELGNANIFNAVKYQVFTQIPSEEKNNTTGFIQKTGQFVNNNPDYILLRDVVGDVRYHEDYLTLQLKYAAEYTNQHGGCKQLSFLQTAKTQVSATTDQRGYDLVQLIQWATGKEKVTAGTVISQNTYLGGLAEVVSDGAEYLNVEEVEVIKNYYKNATGIDEAKWNVLWKKVTETPNGYLIFDPSRINRMLSNLISSSGITGANAAEAYFKYVETLQWADNEKDFGTAAGGAFAGSPPNKERIADHRWYHTSGSGISFQDNKGVWWRQGGYDASYYNSREYQEDNTEYLSDVEIEILKVLLLNNAALGRLTNTLAKEIVDEFDASLVQPTFFTADGISTLINRFYEDATILVAKDSAYTVASQDGCPAVYNMDGIRTGLNYFTELSSLKIQGNGELYAFLGEKSLEQFFNRMSNTNQNITQLGMEYCAGNYVSFDVEATKNLARLRNIDYSHNPGLTEVNSLVNTRRKQYTTVNISYIGANDDQNYFTGKQYDFTKYAVQNLASDTCSVIYGNGVTAVAGGASEELTLLADFNQLIAENMFSVNQVVNADGSMSDITWRIEEGNPIHPTMISVAGTTSQISSFDEMEEMISPYFYCSQAFTYLEYSYEQGHVYRFAHNEAGELTITDLGIHEEIASTDGIVAKDLSEFTNVDELIGASSPESEMRQGGKVEAEEERSESTIATDSFATTFGGIVSSGTDYDISFGVYTIAFLPDRWSQYYISDRGGYLEGINIQDASTLVQYNVFFALLSEKQARCLEYLKEGHSWSEIMAFVATTNGEVTALDKGDGTYSFQFSRLTLKNNLKVYIYSPYSQCYFNGLQNWQSVTMTDRFTDDAGNILPGEYNYRNRQLSNNNFYLTQNYGGAPVGAGASQAPTYLDVYNLELSGGEYTSLTETAYAPLMTIRYKDGSAPTVVMNVEEIDYEITETTETYYETVSQSYNAQELILEDQKYYLPTEQMVYKAKYSCLHDEVITGSRVDEYRVKKYNLLVTYTLKNGETITVDWSNIDQLSYKYYLSEEDLTEIEKLVSYADGVLTWSDSSVEIPADTDYLLVEEGEWVGTDPSEVPTFEWRLEHQDFPYISYVKSIDTGAALTRRIETVNTLLGGDTEVVYRYTGSTGNADIYRESNVPVAEGFTYNRGYQLVLTQNGLEWLNFDLPDNAGGGPAMDAIIEEANLHFGDNLYGMYYGRYYAYNGPEQVTNKGIRYKTNWIYRIMPNASNSAFTFAAIKPFVSYNNIDIPLLEIVNGSLGDAQRENAYYMDIGAAYNDASWRTRTYYDGFYVFTYNAGAGSYYFKTFCDVYYNANNNAAFGNTVQFNNTRINAGSNQVCYNGEGYYGGTGGNIPTVISAVVHKANGDGTYTDTVRYFKVNVRG